MSILEKLKAIDERDIDGMSKLIHDNYDYFALCWKDPSKQDVLDWVASDDINASKVRILYENDEVGVNHSVVRLKDGNVQILAFFRFKDGKVFRQETGASNFKRLKR